MFGNTNSYKLTEGKHKWIICEISRVISYLSDFMHIKSPLKHQAMRVFIRVVISKNIHTLDVLKSFKLYVNADLHQKK